MLQCGLKKQTKKITLNERSQSQRLHIIGFYKMTTQGNFIDRKKITDYMWLGVRQVLTTDRLEGIWGEWQYFLSIL